MNKLENMFYAHSKEYEPPEKWQRLEEHLKNVGEMARGFAQEFGAGEWGYFAGLWHDLAFVSENALFYERRQR